ncbi:aminoacyl-histidine dipeptidase [Desulfitobacterium metallireducens]|uniref:Cytosol non-specific dipeptidase n=1 Tax=Desulfitobacterium metallireducens DSM 15288 TaxID=871968 RepID=W0EBI3_9FIRM|nr:aminoacyl-histidine dipeptidase [Desulfitobacterium metallireducens]AHF08200.1 aminoacyl-histidine dipeptidase [Desulfitobacterium metallireducens DSM 15288]
MLEMLKDLQPVEVFKYFEKLSQIPRGSGNEKEVSDYLVSFAKEYSLEFVQDSALNVVIKKKATPGYENSPTVVLQGHMDMVCEKNIGNEHDFTKDPLKLRVIDDMIYATGTTLGADNGIAVAMGLAILASNEYQHPAIELLVTTSEETGMDGAMALDPKNIEGRTLINIDSEEEGTLLVSCAGGVTAKTLIPAAWEPVDANLVPYIIKIRGLKGGHSGMEIDKERGNTNKLMGRILMSVLSEIDFRLSSLNGGSKRNAIPRETDAVIMVKAEDKALVEKRISDCEALFTSELRTQDPDVRVEFEVLPTLPPEMLTKESTNNGVNYLYLVINGVTSMSMDIKGLVESSLNLGVVSTLEDSIEFISSIRSSVRSLKNELLNRLVVTAKLNGGTVVTESVYPEWAYNPTSKIRTIFEDVYAKMYGKKPHITAIHAGLECGLFAEKFGEMDAISFGPNLYDVHTPNEHMSISSVQRTWEYLLEILKNLH